MNTHRPKDNVIGYQFAVSVRKGDEYGFIALCPGVGGVYEEGATKDEAMTRAAEAACAVLEARSKVGEVLDADGPYLRVLRRPKRAANVVPMPVGRTSRVETCLLPAMA